MFGKSKGPELQTDFDVFAMYDSKVGNYHMPMFALNGADIQREFMNAFTSQGAEEKNQYYKNAEDYSLFKIGAYSKKAGVIVSQQPEHLVNMHDLRFAAEKQKQRPGALSPT